MHLFRTLSTATLVATGLVSTAQSPANEKPASGTTPRIPAYASYQAGDKPIDLAQRPVHWPVKLLDTQRETASNGCYTMRTYRFEKDPANVNALKVAGSTTCSEASQFEMKTIVSGRPNLAR